jgi:hypothetical protein
LQLFDEMYDPFVALRQGKDYICGTRLLDARPFVEERLPVVSNKVGKGNKVNRPRRGSGKKKG